DAELAPDHAVEGTGVADDVDALDEDALALLELEDDVDDAVGIVAFDPRHDVDEGVALLAGWVGHALDHPLDLAGVVDRTGPDLAQQRFELRRIEAGDHRDDRGLAEAEPLALAHGEGDEEGVALGREFGGGGSHLEIDEAALEVELAQELLVEGEAVLVVGGAAEDRGPEARLAGLDRAAEPAVGEGLVADEGHALDRCHPALGDLVDEIDAV